MSSQIAEILDQLEDLQKQVAELPQLKARITKLESRPPGQQSLFPLPAKRGSTQLRLITQARTDPEGAIAEAKRLAREDTARKRRGEA